MFDARWETIESFVSDFITPAAKCVFNKSLIGTRRKSTGRRVNAVHQGGIGAPNELATFRVHDAVVDFVKQSVWKARNCAASNPRSG